MNNKNQEEYNKAVNKAFWQVKAVLSPGTSPQVYLEACNRYRSIILGFNRPKHFGSRIITKEEAKEIPDNSAIYEDFTYTYEGLESIQAMVSTGKPIAFIMWHHGAVHHSDYGLSRVLPNIAFFTKLTLQYGKVFSYSMMKSQALNLVRMDRFLREGRPVLYYLDGVPLGETVTLPILGISSRIATAPIKVIRSVEGVRIIPVTTSYRDGKEVEIIFHPPMPDPGKISQMKDRKILRLLLDFFQKEKKEKTPEQVMWWHIIYREFQARKMIAERIRKRQEMT